MLRARDLVRLLRPHQWVKNGFVLAGLVFGHGWDDARTVALALSAFVAFCLASTPSRIAATRRSALARWRGGR